MVWLGEACQAEGLLADWTVALWRAVFWAAPRDDKGAVWSRAEVQSWIHRSRHAQRPRIQLIKHLFSNNLLHFSLRDLLTTFIQTLHHILATSHRRYNMLLQTSQ